ncbi:hypothetical protein ACFLYO_10865 [Chloroflexota bacterium]
MVDMDMIRQLSIRIRHATEQEVTLLLSKEEAESLAKLLDDLGLLMQVDVQGKGRSLGEIASAGGFGGWADRDDIGDGAIYAEELRRRAENRS